MRPCSTWLRGPVCSYVRTQVLFSFRLVLFCTRLPLLFFHLGNVRSWSAIGCRSGFCRLLVSARWSSRASRTRRASWGNRRLNVVKFSRFERERFAQWPEPASSIYFYNCLLFSSLLFISAPFLGNPFSVGQGESVSRVSRSTYFHLIERHLATSQPLPCI